MPSILDLLGKRPMIGTGRSSDYFPQGPDLSYLRGASKSASQIPTVDIGEDEDWVEQQKENQKAYDEQQAIGKLRSIDYSNPDSGKQILQVLSQHPMAEQSPIVRGHIDLARKLVEQQAPLTFEAPEDEKHYHDQKASGKSEQDARQSLSYFKRDRQAIQKIESLGLDPSNFMKDGKVDHDSAVKGIVAQENRNKLAKVMDPSDITELEKKYPKGIPEEVITSTIASAANEENNSLGNGSRVRSPNPQLTEDIARPWRWEQEVKQSGVAPRKVDIARNESTKQAIITDMENQLKLAEVPEDLKKGIFKKGEPPDMVAFNRALDKTKIQQSLDSGYIPENHKKLVFKDDGSIDRVAYQHVLDTQKFEDDLKSTGLNESRIDQVREPNGLIDKKAYIGLKEEALSKTRKEMNSSEAKQFYDAKSKSDSYVPSVDEKKEFLLQHGVDPDTASKEDWAIAYNMRRKSSPEYKHFYDELNRALSERAIVPQYILDEYGLDYPPNIIYDHKTRTTHPFGAETKEQSQKKETPQSTEERKVDAKLTSTNPSLTGEEAEIAAKKEVDDKESEKVNKKWTDAKQDVHKIISDKIDDDLIGQYYSSIRSSKMGSEPYILELSKALGVNPDDSASKAFKLKGFDQKTFTGSDVSVRDLLKSIAGDKSVTNKSPIKSITLVK